MTATGTYLAGSAGCPISRWKATSRRSRSPSRTRPRATAGGSLHCVSSTYGILANTVSPRRLTHAGLLPKSPNLASSCASESVLESIARRYSSTAPNASTSSTSPATPTPAPRGAYAVAQSPDVSRSAPAWTLNLDHCAPNALRARLTELPRRVRAAAGQPRVGASGRQAGGLLEWAGGWPRRTWTIEGALLR